MPTRARGKTRADTLNVLARVGDFWKFVVNVLRAVRGRFGGKNMRLVAADV